MSRMVFFVGVDGCGKSTLARFVAEHYQRQGCNTTILWSRFNNLLSKPLLALARLTGHNYYETHDGVRFGYHNFEHECWLRYPFVLTQALDVNLANLCQIRRVDRKAEVFVFERSAWDTLADVILDTGCEPLMGNRWGRWITAQARGRGNVIWISRSKENIVQSRPELRHDRKLSRKIAIYGRLAAMNNWPCLDNNRPLAEVQADLRGMI